MRPTGRMTWCDVTSGLALAACIASLAACATPGPSGPPNVLLITMDTTRRDHCSLYGYRRPTTPNLEKLAAEGVVFDRAYAASSSTAPSHASLFTGLYPIAHGVIKDDTIVVATSDHGEGLGQHNWLLHGLNIYEEQVQAPLVVRWPRHIAARRLRDAPAEHVDVMPTVLELAGVPSEPEPGWQGRSLAGGLRGTEPFEEERPIFVHRQL